MHQLRYAWKDIKDQKMRNLVLFVQIAAALVLFSFVVYIVLHINSYQNKLNRIIEGEEIYFSRDMTDRRRFDEMVTAPGSSERLSKLYTFMTQNPSFATYTADAQHFMWMTDDHRLDNSLAVRSQPPLKGYKLLKIDEKFIDVYELECAEGSLFTEEDFAHTGEVILLLLGHDFRRFYQLHDVIRDSRGFRYQVTGFLEESSYFLQPGKSGEIYSLDKWFVIPVRPDRDGAYDSAIMSTYIITDDSYHLQEIQQKSTELGLYTFEFRSFTAQMRRIHETNNLHIRLIGFMLSVVLIFSMIGLISNLVQFIDTHTKEFAIHLLCGGQVVSIIQRILIQILLLIIAANVIVLAIHRGSLTSLITIAFSLIVGLLIVIYPAIKLSTIGINNLLRRSE